MNKTKFGISFRIKIDITVKLSRTAVKICKDQVAKLESGVRLRKDFRGN